MEDAVSKVFILSEFNCRLHGTNRDKLLNRHAFSDIVEFGVNVVEYYMIMDMTEKDHFIKMLVLEDGMWRVFAGVEKLQLC